MKLEELSWADELVENIKEYIYVREKDSLLILLPNNAYKLNPTALYILKQMTGGAKVVEILNSKFNNDVPQNVIDDMHYYFCDLRALMSGCLCNVESKKAVDIIKFERPHNLLPVLSEIALTYKCNLACKFCYAGCNCKSDKAINTNISKRIIEQLSDQLKYNSYKSTVGKSSSDTITKDMSTEDVKKILDIIKNVAEVPSVSFTGGEPTLRDDLVELVEFATKLGLRVNLITNGTNLNEDYIINLKNAGLKSVQVSLEGGSSKVHDDLTQVPGSFLKTINAVKLLLKNNVNVHTNTTLNQLNKDHLEELVSFISTLGTKRFSMNLIIPTKATIASELAITYTEAADIIKNIQTLADKYEIEFMWYSPTPYCIFNPVQNKLGGKSCAACDGLLSVSANGDVLPCSSLPKSVGNLLKEDFNKVWNSKRSLYWRNKEYAHKKCKKCDIFEVCTGACPIYWDYMGFSELL